MGKLAWYAKSCLQSILTDSSQRVQGLSMHMCCHWGQGIQGLRKRHLGEKSKNELKEVMVRGILEQCEVLEWAVFSPGWKEKTRSRKCPGDMRQCNEKWCLVHGFQNYGSWFGSTSLCCTIWLCWSLGSEHTMFELYLVHAIIPHGICEPCPKCFCADML